MKKTVLFALIALYTSPLFAHDPFHRHGPSCRHDHSPGGFVCDSGPLPEDQASYIELPDGTHYVLDSKFWEAAKELAALLEEEHDHGHDHDITTIAGEDVRAPWQRLSDAAAVRLEPLLTDLQHKHFWITLSAKGVSLFRRYGLPAVVIIGGGEAIEHSVCPLPLGCAAIYTAGIFSGKHIMRFWNLVRSEFPLEASLPNRLALGIQQWQWNWRYWRAMKNIYQVSAENRSHLNETDPDSKLAVYFLAQEKTAFLEMQLQLAEQSVAPLATSHGWIYQAVNWHLTTLGQAIDRYSAFLSGLALSGKAIENEPALAEIDTRFEQFFMSLNDFLKTIEEGSLPLTSAMGQAIWKGPRELKDSIRSLQKLGCEKWLEKF